MRFKANFQVPKVNLSRFQEAMHTRLSENLAQAGMVWLEATAEGRVPVWSGASRATFSPLASYVGYVLSLAPLNSAPNRVQLGIDNGKATFEAGTQNPAVYSFSYSTTLPHLIVNEYHNANTFINPATGEPYFHLTWPGPYDFQGKGKRSFQKFAANEVRLPGWASILDVTSLSVG